MLICLLDTVANLNNASFYYSPLWILNITLNSKCEIIVSIYKTVHWSITPKTLHGDISTSVQRGRLWWCNCIQFLSLLAQKSCSRCNKNTRHIESSYILQPPKYLLLFVNRFRYLNNNIIKDRCPIPLDATLMLGPLKFNLQATIDHHGPSIDSGHYTASINCCKKTFYCNDHKITEFGITDKNSSTAYIVLYKWIDTWFMDSDRKGGSLIAPMALAHPLHPIDNRSRNKRRNLWVGRCVSSWWPWFPSRDSVLIYMYIYVCTFLIRVLL